MSLLLDICQQLLTLIDDLSQNISLFIFFYFFLKSLFYYFSAPRTKMNSALLPNISMSQPLLPPTGASTTAGTPNNNNPLGNNNGGGPADRSMEPGSSPLRSSQDKPENGLSINYAGQVRVLSHSHLYGGPVGVPEPRAGDVSTSLDDSRGWGTGTSDDQMSPKEQSSSPDHVPRSINARSEDGDDDAHPMRSSGDSLERLREICDKSLPQHGNTMIDTASNEQIQPDGSTIFHCHLCSYTSPSRDEFNEHVNDHYEFRYVHINLPNIFTRITQLTRPSSIQGVQDGLWNLILIFLP